MIDGVKGEELVNMFNKKNSVSISVHILSFVIPIALYMGIWGMKGIGINGDYSPLAYDLKAQYLAFFSALRDVFLGKNSLFFNWSIGYGGSFLPIFAYYLGSPLNLIFLFFKLEHIHIAIYCLTLLKIGLCGLTFSFFLRFDLHEGEARFIQIAFSCCYALMSYTVMYGMNLMWLDSLILLPVILLGISHILRGKNGFVYFCAITLLFVTNYYMAYMVGVFAALYFISELFAIYSRREKKGMLRAILLFGIHTINGLLVSAMLLLPTFISYFDSIKSEKTPDDETWLYMIHHTFLDVSKKLLPQMYDSIDYYGLPSIYCGSIIAILALLFLTRKTNVREKIRMIFLLAIIGAGFFQPDINKAWHGFRWPHSFPYRYAFLFSAVLIIYAYKTYMSITGSEKYKSIYFVLAGYTILELYMNGVTIIDGLQNEVNYSHNIIFEKSFACYDELMDCVKDDSRYARVGKDRIDISFNDPLLFGVGGIDSCMSTYNAKLVLFADLLGTDTPGEHMTTSRGQTPFVDSIFGVKYRLSLQELTNPYVKKTDVTQDDVKIHLYENTRVLSWGIVVPAECKNGISLTDNRINNQNILASSLVGENVELYHPLDVKQVECDEEWTIQFESNIMKEGECIIYLDGMSDLGVKKTAEGEQHLTTVYLDGTPVEVYNNGSFNEERITKHIYNLGNVKTGKHRVKIKIPPYFRTLSLNMYQYDLKEFDRTMDYLAGRQVTDTWWDKTKVEGTVDIEDNSILFTTIPAVKGMSVTVDGKKVSTFGQIGPFIAVELQSGIHDVRIEYRQPGLLEGVCLFTIGGAGELLLWYMLCKKQRKRIRITC